MNKTNKIISLLLILIFISSNFIGCTTDAKSQGETKVKLGVTGSETEVWAYIKEELAKENIILEVVSFGDYTRPNIALAEGEIDINSFQHYAFFDKFIAEHKLDLTPIGETIIAPLGLYSSKIKDLSELKSKDKVAIPNDQTNGGRTLILLQTAGLIKVNPDAGYLPTLKDITENPLELEIVEMDASTTPRALDDVALAAINSGIAVDAGFLPTADAVFLEPIDDNSQPFINIIAAKTKDKDNKILKRIVEIYQTKEVEEIINEIYKGSQVRAW